MGVINFWRKRKSKKIVRRSKKGGEEAAQGLEALDMIQDSGEDAEIEKEIEEEREMGEKVRGTISEMTSFLGIKLKIKKYPSIDIVKRYSSAYSSDQNRLIINEKDVGSGDAIGEEVGHFLRNQFRKDSGKKESLTSEFFGFLGRRILKESEEGKCFSWNPDPVGSKSEALALIEKHKTKQEEYEMYADGSKVDPDGILTPKIAKLKAQEEANQRENILIHYRGYESASRFDLSRISNWKKLFSLPDKEVRRRFFRSDPDYSGL